ncbi:MAG: hypothetical protein RJB38_2136 [Pseudomonadota bacterium]|jgi:hypothetical protein
MTKQVEGHEKRKSKRRPVLESFSVFLSAPDHVPYRLSVQDVSDLGIGFQLAASDGASALWKPKVGDTIDARLYLNPTLFIPLKIQVVRFFQNGPEGPQMAGASITELYSAGYRAYGAFLHLLDALAEIAPDSLDQ